MKFLKVLFFKNKLLWNKIYIKCTHFTLISFNNCVHLCDSHHGQGHGEHFCQARSVCLVVLTISALSLIAHTSIWYTLCNYVFINMSFLEFHINGNILCLLINVLFCSLITMVFGFIYVLSNISTVFISLAESLPCCIEIPKFVHLFSYLLLNLLFNKW